MTHFARFALVSLAVVAAAGAAESKAPLPKVSPFMPPASAAAPVAAASETIEFAGVSAVGKRTDLIFYDKTAKKSHWIGVGESKEGISVVNYDSRREQAVVKINGAEKVLPLRKGNGPVNAPAGVAQVPVGFNVPPPPVVQPMPLPLPPAVSPAMATGNAPATPPPGQPATPAAPNTPEAQVKAETEARMLVSDLLEIGMAQRKAYEEAQRRAQTGNAAQPGTEQPPAQPAPTPEK